jgi:bifunctional enzyme CysN/CysC
MTAETARERLPVVLVGHVDHGKSTLVGRLFHDTGSLPEGRLEAIREMCRRRGMPFEWGFLTDALQGERDQGVTIDTAHIWFRTAKRDYVLIDAPGHKEFLRNMVTGAAQADAALLLIDAAEGVREQSRRHGHLLHLLGVGQVIVVINKIDRIDYARERIVAIETEYGRFLSELGVVPRFVIPISAREGDNVAGRSPRTPWYEGPSVLEALDHFEPSPAPVDMPLRLPVQDVYKFDDRRIIAGRIETGLVRTGDRVLFSPSNKTAHVASLEAWQAEAPMEARAGESVGITLDEPLFVERGEVISHTDSPPVESDVFRVRLFWLGRAPMRADARYKLKLNTTEVGVAVQSIESVVEAADLSAAPTGEVSENAVGEAVLRADRLIALDEYAASPATGRFVLVDGHQIVGGGTLSMAGYPDQRALVQVRSTNITTVAHAVAAEERRSRNRHRGGVLWFTGLSGAGKSTLASAVERALFERGFQVYVLDGDNIRAGLNANLGFAPEERAENIRRVGEAAALFGDAGMVVITAFISPYRADRDRARSAAERMLGAGAFQEVYVKAELAVCEARDPKGLYARARRGEIAEFTGVSAPYEEPDRPDLVVDTSEAEVGACVQRIVAFVEGRFAQPR